VDSFPVVDGCAVEPKWRVAWCPSPSCCYRLAQRQAARRLQSRNSGTGVVVPRDRPTAALFPGEEPPAPMLRFGAARGKGLVAGLAGWRQCWCARAGGRGNIRPISHHAKDSPHHACSIVSVFLFLYTSDAAGSAVGTGVPNLVSLPFASATSGERG